MHQISPRLKKNRQILLSLEYCKIPVSDLNWAYNLKPSESKLYIACWVSDRFSSQFQALRDFNWKSRSCDKARKKREPQEPFQFRKVADYPKDKSVAYLEMKNLSRTFQICKKVPTDNQKNCKYYNCHNLYGLETPPPHKKLVFQNYGDFIEYSPELEKKQKLDKYRKLIILLSDQHLKDWVEIFIINFSNKSGITNKFSFKRVCQVNRISEAQGCNK